MAQAISEFTKGPTNGLNSVSIFIQDNFERAAAENFTTQVTLVFCFENCSDLLREKLFCKQTKKTILKN
jgi:hypothetical protein